MLLFGFQAVLWKNSIEEFEGAMMDNRGSGVRKWLSCSFRYHRTATRNLEHGTVNHPAGFLAPSSWSWAAPGNGAEWSSFVEELQVVVKSFYTAFGKFRYAGYFMGMANHCEAF